MPTRSGRHLSSGKNGGLQPRAAGVAIPRQGQNRGAGESSTAADLEMDLPPAPSPVLPVFNEPSSSPAFQPAQELVVYTRVQAGEKPKGGAYLHARQLPGAGMLFAPTSHLLHLHPLSASTSLTLEGWEHLSMGFVGGGAPERTWWGHTSWPALSKTVFISAPAASASFLPVLLHFRHTARLSVPSAGRGVKVVHDKDKTAPLLLSFAENSLG